MDRVNIYLVDNHSIKKVIIKLTEKMYGDGYKVDFLCRNTDVDMLDSMLWAGTSMFIPHGTDAASCVYITDNTSNLRFAGCLMTLNTIQNDSLTLLAAGSYGIIIHIFDLTYNKDNIDVMNRIYKECDKHPVIWECIDNKWAKKQC